MKVNDLVALYQYKLTSDVVVEMEDTIIFNWSADRNRHPDDGSYSNPLHYMPTDISNAEIKYFTIIPQYMALDNKPIKLADTETLYITIPVYSELYRYFEDDNYPFA